MDSSTRTAISARALALVQRHFELLDHGDLAAARAQLFFPPGMNQRPLDVYVETMSRIAPFELISIRVTRLGEPRPRRHGVFSSIWVSVQVRCSLGERSTDIIVWWFPEDDRLLISARPSHWVLEKLSLPP